MTSLVSKPGVSPTEETAEGGGVTSTGLPPNEEEIYKTLEEVTILSNNSSYFWHCNCRGLSADSFKFSIFSSVQPCLFDLNYCMTRSREL